ncbi:MAG: ATP-binding protein [Candidatus Aceula meridiana]|nr:ATP-binding protein [Candidatus Aceula meridiana]
MANWTTILQSPYYYFNVSSLIPFIFCNLAFFMGVFILGTAARASFHRAVFYFYISCSMWFLGYALSLNAWVDPVAFFWGKIVYLGIVLVPVTLMHISLVVTEHYKQKRIFVWIVYIGVFILFLQTWGNPFFIGIEEYPWGFSPKAQSEQIIFLSFSFLCFAYAFLNIMRHYINFIRLPQRREMDKPYRRKLELIMAAFVLTSLSNFTALNNYGMSIYPFGLLMLFLAMGTMGYALVKYHNVAFLLRLRELGSEVTQAQNKVKKARLKLADMGKASIFASLSAGILHQMCQPITAVHGLAKFMHNSMKQDDPYFKSVDLILEQSSYMKEMLNDLMDLVRHKEIRKENINMNICVERALRLLKDEFRIKRINWDFFAGENLPDVFVDSIHLEETFMNISVNAIEALGVLDRGEKRYLKISTVYEPDENKVSAYFENTGPTFSESQKEHIFEPFFTSRSAGSGIGLALCKDLMTEHGGDVYVENIEKEGKDYGVRFCVRLPVVSS